MPWETEKVSHTKHSLCESSHLCTAPASQAEILGALAIVAAGHVEEGRAEQLVNEALEKTAENGERDVLVRVARSAGEAYLLLNRRADARKALTLAMTHAQAADAADGGSPIPAEDLLGVLVGLQECGDEDPNLTTQALLLIPSALDDVNAWWELPRLFPRVIHLAERGLFAQDGPQAAQLRAAAQRLVEAGSQRSDCQEAAGQLGRSLSRSAVTL